MTEKKPWGIFFGLKILEIVGVIIFGFISWLNSILIRSPLECQDEFQICWYKGTEYVGGVFLTFLECGIIYLLIHGTICWIKKNWEWAEKIQEMKKIKGEK